MPTIVPSVSYCTASDVSLELDLTSSSGGFVLWGRAITLATITDMANLGNDKVYALTGDVSASTSYKNNLAVRLATKYAVRELISHMALHWVDFAFNYSLGDQRIDRGSAAIEGFKVAKEHLDQEIQSLEWSLTAGAEGGEVDTTERGTYSNRDSVPYMP